MTRRAGRSPRGIHFEWSDDLGKPPLVLIMGYASGLASWGERFLAKVGERYSYLILDNRGTGQSIKPDRSEEFSIDAMADDVAEVVLSVFKAPVHLVGYSMGGCIAQDVALRGLAPLSKLTLIASTAGGKHFTSPGPDVLKSLSEPKGEKLLDYFVATWHVCMGKETTAKHWDELLEIFSEQAKHLTPRSAMRGHLAAYTRFSAGDRLGNLAVPTQIIAGVDDPLTPVENSRALARLIPGAKLHLLPGTKHNPHTECPTKLLEILESI